MVSGRYGPAKLVKHILNQASGGCIEVVHWPSYQELRKRHCKYVINDG